MQQFEFSADGTGLRPAQLSAVLDEVEAGLQELQEVIDAARKKVDAQELPF